MFRKVICAALLAVLVVSPATGQQKKRRPKSDRPRNSPAPSKTVPFKTIGDTALKMHIFHPEGVKPGDNRPAVVFFFGGGWRGGSPRQFFHQSKYLASRGMVAMCAEYRVYSRHKARIVDCVADAKSAMRWARANAGKLGIDPDRIASGGGSAGGHLGGAVGTLDGFDEKTDDRKVSPRPNAMLLFNPALNLTAEAFGVQLRSKRYKEIHARMGAEPRELSPSLHVGKSTPPAIVFHGKADPTVPYSQAEEFARRMKEAGNNCVLAGYEGQPHGFFNWGRGGNKMFVATIRRADRFLQSLGWLKGEDTVADYVESAGRKPRNKK